MTSDVQISMYVVFRGWKEKWTSRPPTWTNVLLVAYRWELFGFILRAEEFVTSARNHLWIFQICKNKPATFNSIPSVDVDRLHALLASGGLSVSHLLSCRCERFQTDKTWSTKLWFLITATTTLIRYIVHLDKWIFYCLFMSTCNHSNC